MTEDLFCTDLIDRLIVLEVYRDQPVSVVNVTL